MQRSIMEGEKETGVTIMRMVRKMDAGNMIRWQAVPIAPNDTAGVVEEKLTKLGSELLLQVIHDFEVGMVVDTPQDETKVTYAAKIELEDCEINWSKSAQEIHNLIRGVNPFPGAWCWVTVKGERKRLKIWESRLSGSEGYSIPCGDGSLQLIKVQLEGKKAMDPLELFRGTKVEFI